MTCTFLVSDTHFGHVGVTKFLRADGVTKLRPWDNTEEMDEALVANWNSVVTPEDTIYHLGDVVLKEPNLKIMERLNGRKKLILGNHDVFDVHEYLKYFEDIKGSHQLDGFLLTHFPIHPESLFKKKGNFHGHIHDGYVMKEVEEATRTTHGDYTTFMTQVRDPRYLCLSVENTNYTPITFDEARKRFKEQQ